MAAGIAEKKKDANIIHGMDLQSKDDNESLESPLYTSFVPLSFRTALAECYRNNHYFL